MKKLQLLFMALIMSGVSVNAQLAEVSPISGTPTESSNALFDLLYTLNVGSTGSIGADGNAGIAFVNNQYWVSAWASDLIHILDSNGGFVETITIAGVTGTRSITTDGTDLFIGAAGADIYRVDPVTRVLQGTIPILPGGGSDATARMLTYDETLDGGSGGFWIGNFGSDIASVSMFGVTLSVIPSATHNTVIYGGVVDNISPGGPFLWISDQSGTSPAQNFLTQLDPATGVPTGVVYDFFPDSGSDTALAGGLFVSDAVSPTAVALVGLCQCGPSNVIYAVELVALAGVNENEISSLSLYPNPATRGVVNIETALQGDKQVIVMDVLGKTVINTTISGTELNISSLKGGVYMVQVVQNNATATRKLIVN
tara:strand:+ start:1079 stop:2188 length:1110 start_codon:yes stop_codon:yes gene_type:complete